VKPERPSSPLLKGTREYRRENKEVPVESLPSKEISRERRWPWSVGVGEDAQPPLGSNVSFPIEKKAALRRGKKKETRCSQSTWGEVHSRPRKTGY